MLLLSNFNPGERVVQITERKNFVILCGGPGLYDARDPKHDQYWASYVLPFMIAAKRGTLDVAKNETIHWCVHRPAYADRWNDDHRPTADELARKHRLSDLRFKHSQEILGNDYLDHMRTKAAEYSKYRIEFVELDGADGFWRYLSGLPLGSLHRVWYFGHASNDLWLDLEHSSRGAATRPEPHDIVEIDQIVDHADLADRFAAPADVSKFFGCNTAAFAERWTRTFAVPSEGADVSVHFGGMSTDTIEQSAERYADSRNDGLNWLVKLFSERDGWVRFDP